MIPRLLVLWLLAICICSSAVQAEPITVDAGSAIVDPMAGPGPTMYANLSGDAFSLAFIWRDARAQCIFSFDCRSGDPVTLTTTLHSSPPVTTPPGENQAFSFGVAYTGSLTFAGPTFVLPIPSAVPSAADFSGPFTFSGTLSTYRVLGVFEPQLLSTLELVGAGTVTGRYVAIGSQTYWLNRLEYEFAPIPEPGTLLLAGTGLAAAGAMRRRRKSARPA